MSTQNETKATENIQAESQEDKVEDAAENKSSIVIKLKSGQTLETHPRQRKVSCEGDASHTIPFIVQMSPQGKQKIEERKRLCHYTVEQLKKLRHNEEMATSTIMKFHSEIQLFKRYMSNSHKKSRRVIHNEIPALQLRIHATLLNLTVCSYKQVFDQICSLSRHENNFALSFVNVLFKHAVMNSEMSFFYSFLVKNLIPVLEMQQKSSRIASLLYERIEESFVVPKEDTDKGTLILLHGIASFAGSLLGDKIIHAKAFTKWSDALLTKGSPQCLTLLLDMIDEMGMGLIDQLRSIEPRISALIPNMPQALAARAENTAKVIRGDVEYEEKREEKIRSLGKMARSPSIDRNLDSDYNKLFTKSESIPQDLSQLASFEEGQDSLHGILQTYSREQDVMAFISGFNELGYIREDKQTTMEFIKGIIEEQDVHRYVLLELVMHMMNQDFYTAAQLIETLKELTVEFSEDLEKGTTLVNIFVLLVRDRLASLDDFKDVFAAMRPLWESLIPTFLNEADSVLGNLFDDIVESEFWLNTLFIEEVDMIAKLEKLNEMGIISFYPQFETLYQFYRAVLEGNVEEAYTFVTTADCGIEKQELASFIFSVLSEMDVEKASAAVTRLADFFKEHGEHIKSHPDHYQPNGVQLAKLI